VPAAQLVQKKKFVSGRTACRVGHHDVLHGVRLAERVQRRGAAEQAVVMRGHPPHRFAAFRRDRHEARGRVERVGAHLTHETRLERAARFRVEGRERRTSQGRHRPCGDVEPLGFGDR
jgi:hypothetical protein